MAKKTGLELIAQERKEQIEKHGIQIFHDKVVNSEKQLSKAARKLLIVTDTEKLIGFEPDGWNEKIWEKMVNKPRKERLIMAGALIAAELDRMNTISE